MGGDEVARRQRRREGRVIANAARKYNRVFRTDTEVRSELKFLNIAQVVRNGRIGKVKRVVVTVIKDPPPLEKNPEPMPVPPELNYEMWQGPAPERPYTEQRVHAQRDGIGTPPKRPGWFQIRDYNLGGDPELGAHLLDITQWALDKERTGPTEVEGIGEFPRANLWNVLQHFAVRYRYEDGVEVDYTNDGKPHIRFKGTDGWIEHTWFKADGFNASHKELLTWKPGPNDVVFPLITEKQDFLNCIKSRKPTMIDAEIGHRAATMAQIGHFAIETGAKLKWDPTAERFTNNDAANRLLRREHRTPWAVQLTRSDSRPLSLPLEHHRKFR